MQAGRPARAFPEGGAARRPPERRPTRYDRSSSCSCVTGRPIRASTHPPHLRLVIVLGFRKVVVSPAKPSEWQPPSPEPRVRARGELHRPATPHLPSALRRRRTRTPRHRQRLHASGQAQRLPGHEPSGTKCRRFSTPSRSSGTPDPVFDPVEAGIKGASFREAGDASAGPSEHLWLVIRCPSVHRTATTGSRMSDETTCSGGMPVSGRVRFPRRRLGRRRPRGWGGRAWRGCVRCGFPPYAA